MILAAILLLLAAPLVMLILSLVQRILPSNQRSALELQASLIGRVPLVGRMILSRSAFAYYWLVALAGTLAAWVLVLLSRPRLTYTISLVNWRPVTYFPDSPKILVDPVSWSFALALATLVLAVVLTVPMRQQGVNDGTVSPPLAGVRIDHRWSAWASSLALAGFGLLAVLAGNPLTLMLAWAAIDILEIFILLGQVPESKVHVQAMVAISARVAGLGLLLWAGVSAGSAGDHLSLTTVPPRLSLFLLLAAGLRLGVLPLHLPFLHEPPLRRGLGTSLRLVPAAASLVLLARTANAGVSASWAPYLLVLVGLSALYGAVLWFFAPDELNGRPFWILGMTAFAVASAVCGLPEASLAWGLACIFSGGLLFLFSVRNGNLLPLPLFGLLGFLGLPFTPAWGGMQLYASRSFIYILPVFVLAHVLLVSGYIRHAIRAGSLRTPARGGLTVRTPETHGLTVRTPETHGLTVPERPQRWVWVLYPLGLALFPIVQFGWLFQAMRWSGDLSGHPPSGVLYRRLPYSPISLLDYSHMPLLTWLGGVVTLGLAVLLLWIGYRLRADAHRAVFGTAAYRSTDDRSPSEWYSPLDRYPHQPGRRTPTKGGLTVLLSFGQRLFSLGWLYNLLGLTLRLSVRFVGVVTGVLEGEGGILWVLAFLALMVALLLRGGQL